MSTSSLKGAGLYDGLVAIVGAQHVRNDPAALEVYATDATPLHRGHPEVICFPGSTAEVQQVVCLASALSTPLIVRGAGTNLSAATVPQAGGIVLVMTRMKQLLELDTANMTAVVQPGLPTSVLADAVAAAGLLYPPDPGSRRSGCSSRSSSRQLHADRRLRHWPRADLSRCDGGGPKSCLPS